MKKMLCFTLLMIGCIFYSCDDNDSGLKPITLKD